jgi:hypothetical protein
VGERKQQSRRKAEKLGLISDRNKKGVGSYYQLLIFCATKDIGQ